jgi:uncharacterized RDD family membrane protein YckC
MNENNPPVPPNGPSHNPYAAPQAPVADLQATGQPELATLGQRLGGAIVDAIIMMVFVLPFSFVVIPLMSLEPTGFAAGAVGGVFGMVIYLAINGYFLARNGQTVGKKVAKTRIVRSDFSKADIGRIIGLRLVPMWLVGIIPIVGSVAQLVNVLFIFRSSRKCLHDDIADTVVIKVD